MKKVWSELHQPYKMRGKACTIKNAAAGTENTIYTPTSTDGDIIGVSINKPYTDEICGNIYVTIKQGSNEPVTKVAMTQLIPSEQRQYFPVDFERSGEITIDIETVTTDTVTAKKPVVVFHFRDPKESCDKK